MKKLICLLSATAVFLASAISQEETILTIDKQKISKAEFVRTYMKNNNNASFDEKSLKEYMDLFINFKLKVKEAERLGYDTMSSFIKEYNSYRSQLVKPYLTDKETDEKILKEAYERKCEDIHARQIYFAASELVKPKDTLAIYQRAMEAYNKLISGVPWDSVHSQYSQERNKQKKGDIGYFNSLQISYPLENICFRLKKGEISKPQRTIYGYHIVEILDRRPSKGEIRAAHIMVAFPENSTPQSVDSAKAKIAEIYQKLKQGESFEELAKQYSDDKRSAAKGGDLGWFGSGDMIPEFEKNAFALEKDSDYSAPFRTSFGWHIVKRISTRPVQPFEALKTSLSQKIAKNERNEEGRKALIRKIKAEIKFKDNLNTALLLVPYLDSSAFRGKWNAEKAKPIFDKELFTLGNKKYFMQDFAQYLSSYRFKLPASYEMSITYFYNKYIDDAIIAFEDSRLESKEPELKYLLQEYHDGIMLFNLMDQKIWSQAAKDTVILAKYFEDHKTQYVWGPRVEALVVSSPDKELVNKAYAFANDFANGKISAEKIWQSICPDTTQPCLNCQVNLFEKGDNQILDSLGWDKGVTPIVNREGKFGFFVKTQHFEGRPKTYEESKGTVIADYQQFLEDQFVKELKKKYAVVVNQKVLKSLVK
ncbi:MAG TPA: peptidylprolyl isomerase [Bacteroidales bacterium]|nr:peptidylprolyl isomerase [Bacteroidales bacterium]